MSNLTVNTISSINLNNELIQASVSEFKGYARKTAENILEMGRVVFEAKTNLKANKAEFEVFCAGVGFKSTSSSIKKLSQIGMGYLVMKSQADYLPNSRTTLYEISRLAESELKKYITEGVIHQNVLGSVIKSLNGSSKSNESSSNEAGAGAGEERQEEVPNGITKGLTFTCTLKNVTDVAFKAQLQMII
jgi:hypothetical protein